MPLLSATLQESEIDKTVRAVAKTLAPDVQWIRYAITTDWSGDRAIFFRVVLSDDAARKPRLRKVTQQVESLLSEELRSTELGVLFYYNYRSRSEQAKIKEPAWSKR